MLLELVVVTLYHVDEHAIIPSPCWAACEAISLRSRQRCRESLALSLSVFLFQAVWQSDAPPLLHSQIKDAFKDRAMPALHLHVLRVAAECCHCLSQPSGSIGMPQT